MDIEKDNLIIANEEKKMRISTVLFDLDGTLTDSSEGITKSVQYALDKLGITENDEAVLKRYIGPPLDESFAKFHGLSREDALKAVNYYRERYKDTGIRCPKIR